jgi:hypothetical protein
MLPKRYITALQWRRPRTVFAVIAIQRSGTHLLREILNSNNQLSIASEPFNRITQSFCFEKYVASLPEEAYPACDSDQAMKLLDGFIDTLDADVDRNQFVYGGPKRQNRAIGLDVKYNQLKSAAPAYCDLRQKPFLLEYFHDRHVRIVHLVRRNVVQVAISAIIANMRKVWHNYNGASVGGPYRIPPQDLFNYANWITEERNAFEPMANGLKVHTCYYEDIVDDLQSVDRFKRFRRNTAALSKMAEFLDVRNRFQDHGHIRKVINRPYRALLANYDELISAVQNSPYSEFIASLEPNNLTSDGAHRAA